MAKINVALCITELEIGGAERCLTELAVRIDRQRFSPVVYSLACQPERRERSCLPTLEAAGVPVHCLGGRRAWQFPIVVSRLRRLLASQRAQVIQTFLFHANIVGRIAAHRAGIKAVVSGIRVAERRSRWRLWTDRLTDGLVDRHVCVSQAVADFSVKRGGLSSEKMVAIPNGVDLSGYPARNPASLAAFGIRPGGTSLPLLAAWNRKKACRG